MRKPWTRPLVEVADVARQYGDAYLARYGAVTSTAQRRVLQAVAQCRTAVLGGHKALCDHCGHEEISYNLMNRGRKGLLPSPPSEPCWRFSRTRLSSRWFPHRDWLACT
jgi:Transposase zinc-binding domain